MLCDLLVTGKAFASPVILWLVDKYGVEALEYEPATIYDALYAVDKRVQQAVVDRVNAGLGLFTSDLFWVDPLIFGTVCRALSRHKFPTANAPSTFDLAWGVNEAGLLMLDPDTGNMTDRFSSSVVRFIQLVAKSDGLYSMPQVLSQVSAPMSEMRIADAEMVYARQQEADADAAEIDLKVSNYTVELFSQIKSLNLNITKSASSELNDIVGVK